MKYKSQNQLEDFENGLNNTKYDNKIQIYKTGMVCGKNYPKRD